MKTRPEYNGWVRYENYLAQSRIAVKAIEEEFEKWAWHKERDVKLAIHTAGFQHFTHDNLNIPFNPDWKKIAVNVSGGADSCLLTFLLCKHIEENNLDCKVDIITHQRVWTIRSESFLNLNGDLSIGPKHVFSLGSGDQTNGLYKIIDNNGDQIIVQSYNDFIAAQNNYNAVFNATTKNPTMETPTEDRMRNQRSSSIWFK